MVINVNQLIVHKKLKIHLNYPTRRIEFGKKLHKNKKKQNFIQHQKIQENIYVGIENFNLKLTCKKDSLIIIIDQFYELLTHQLRTYCCKFYLPSKDLATTGLGFGDIWLIERDTTRSGHEIFSWKDNVFVKLIKNYKTNLKFNNLLSNFYQNY